MNREKTNILYLHTTYILGEEAKNTSQQTPTNRTAHSHCHVFRYCGIYMCIFNIHIRYCSSD